MSSRRYYTNILPIEHINGKMAPIAVKCPNTDDPDAIKVNGFWYGYRRREAPTISRYGIRTICRNLNTHPYTTAESENRILFTASLNTVYANKRIAANWELCMRDFRRQILYATPLGYAIAAVRANNGEWLDEWTA